MNILTLLGSPKKKGNTANVLSRFEGLVKAGNEVERIHVPSCEIKGCLGCMACQKVKDSPGCAQKDDAPALFEKMLRADAVLYATPLYCWGFSAQMKALIDRQFCLIKGYDAHEYRSLLKDKPMALLVTCDGPLEDNADLIQVLFERLCAFGQSKVLGKYILPLCMNPETLGREGVDLARKMTEDFAAL